MQAHDRGLSLFLEQVVRLIYQNRDADGLHPVQWAALRYYARAGRKARTVAGLATFLGVTKGPASRSTNRLLRRDYLTSEVNATDRRVPLFSLTKEGRSALESDPIARLAEAISHLSDDKKAVFAACLEEIYTPLRAMTDAANLEPAEPPEPESAGSGPAVSRSRQAPDRPRRSTRPNRKA